MHHCTTASREVFTYKVRAILIDASIGVVISACAGRIGGRAVVNDALDIVGVVVVRAGRLRNSTEPEVRRNGSLISGDNNVVALAHGNVQNRGLVGLDGDEVHGDDSERMVIDHELEVGIDGGIDKTQSVACSLGKAGLPALTSDGTGVVVDVRAVDQPSIKRRGSTALCLIVELIYCRMIPIVLWAC